MKHNLLRILCMAAIPALAFGEPAVGEKLKAAVARAQSERVAVIAIGDSNQRFGGHGYSAAMPKAFATIAPIYASDIVRYRQWTEKNGPERPEAPGVLAKQAFNWYIPEGSTDKVGWQGGQLIIPADHPLDVRGPLRFHFTYGTFESGHTSFKPAVRRDQAPWTIVASAETPINPVTGKYGLERFTLDLAADSSRDYPLQFMPQNATDDISGPFFASQAVVENTARKTGLAYHTLFAVGGKSLLEMLTFLRSSGVDKLTTYFTDVRALLNGKKTAIVMICSGLNDRNRKMASIGPHGVFASSSPEGYADNLEGLVIVLTEAWVAAGGTPETLHFAFMPSHALGDPDDAKLVSYRTAARTLAAKLPNASMIDLPALVPYSEMLANHYYDKGKKTDPHLDRTGYAAIAGALAAELKK